jgi:phosphate transport system substrate-binding protein
VSVKLFPLVTLAIAICATSVFEAATAQDSSSVLKVVGSATVNQPVAKVAQILRREQNIPVLVSTHGGSTEAVRAVGEGRAEIGLLSRSLTSTERASYPDVTFKEHYFGEHVLAVVVSEDVWKSGLKAISKDRLQAIYEKRITNWKQAGGPDEAITFFCPAIGEGSWEIVVAWIYGETRKAPLGDFKVSESHEMAKASVEFTKGSMSIMPPALADGEHSFPIALISDTGQYLRPTPRQIAAGEYPLVRHMLAITDDRPTGPARILIEALLGELGQKIVADLGLMPVAAVREAGGNQFAPASAGPAEPTALATPSGG